MLRWVALYFPRLALDAVLRHQPQPHAPLILIDGPAQRRRVHSANTPARASGIEPGMAVAAARARCHQLVIQPHDAERTQALLQLLANWAGHFSSQVALYQGDALLIEVASSLPLLGPWPELEQRMRRALDTLGLEYRLNAAPYPLAARILCNAVDGYAVASHEQWLEWLAPLPLAHSGLNSDDVAALARMGITRLDELLRLPPSTLARRFSAQLLQHLEQLRGSLPTPLEFYQPAEHFEQRLALEFEATSLQALLFPLRRLINDLVLLLQGRDYGVQRFSVWLEDDEGTSTAVNVGLLSIERSADALFEYARGRLERIEVERPIVALHLKARELLPFVPEKQGLFERRATAGESWRQLQERLRARLGEQALKPLGLREEHRPEHASPSQYDHHARADQRTRPGWLLRQPQPFQHHACEILAGPERIESGWWDDGDIRRDYYLVETAEGRRGWAFRDQHQQWWLQGWFG
ncbi:Y-family DNA polymerase [Carnimonas bestiolae]|uniref:Y-family DNA polymerase n=1 Tax=Carnimonas bestiolae TaxID=3402172 RepID=UPI003EDBEEA7